MRRFLLSDLATAASLLTRAPLRVDHALAGSRAAAAAWAWPVVGAGVGAAIGCALSLALALGAPPLAAAAVAIGAGMVLTGGLHEDGLADCADGIGGGATPARRLEIMRDSRLGAFGVAALALALLAKAALMVELAGAAVLACALAGAVSRAPLALMLRAGPPARPGGLVAGIGRPAAATAVVALGLAFAGAVALAGPAGALAALSACAAAALTHWAARRALGGVTGDVLGAAQALGEIAALWALAAALR